MGLKNIISVISEYEEDERLARNLGIVKNDLNLLSSRSLHFNASELDFKIQNINSLNYDESLDPINRANIAFKNFLEFL